MFGFLAAGSVDTEADTRAVQSRAPSYTLSANELYGEFKANEVAADLKYKGRVVVVSGKVMGIGKDIFDQAYVVIGGRGLLDGVQCTFTEARNSTVALLSKGQFVIDKGEVSGKMGNVQVTKSHLQ